MKKIDLNCDMGESFGAWTMGLDGEVIQHVTSANIACGYHAGDAHVMYKTVKLAKENGVAWVRTRDTRTSWASAGATVTARPGRSATTRPTRSGP